MAEPIIQREDVSDYREAPWQETHHETMRQVSETMVTEETMRKISSEVEPDEEPKQSFDQRQDDKKSSSSSESSSDDDDQEGVRSKEIRQHQFVEETTEVNEQVSILNFNCNDHFEFRNISFSHIIIQLFILLLLIIGYRRI